MIRAILWVVVLLLVVFPATVLAVPAFVIFKLFDDGPITDDYLDYVGAKMALVVRRSLER